MPQSTSHLTLRQRLLCPFVRWYARREFPRKGQLLNWFGMNDQARWADAPVVVARERFHGYQMRLDLSDFFQRIAYFFGCYHEMHVQSVLQGGLRAGDCFVDGGANIGLLTLTAAGVVGPTGRVHAFEPNPTALERLRWHVERNHLCRVVVHPVGLSDVGESRTLTVPFKHNLAGGTLGPLPARHAGKAHERCPVETIRGDDALGDDDPARPMLIKLDVEGFEERALTGLRGTIERRRPAILTEINRERLAVNGSSPIALHDLLSQRGYVPFALDRHGWRGGHRLVVRPIAREEVRAQPDVLWLTRDGPHWARFEAAMR